MALVAMAQSAWTLAVGVVLAGTSAGWSWAPYNDAAEGGVESRYRDRVLSVVSTGTTFGILAAGASWRGAWFAFAACAEATPLFAAALSFGVVSAFYFSFAVDLVARSGGLSRAAGPVVYAVVGAAGFVGLFTGDAVSRFGLGRVLLATLASLGAAAFLLGAAPASWAFVVASASLFGAGVMLMSALLSIWSSAVFPEGPSRGFSAALFVFGVGLTAGGGLRRAGRLVRPGGDGSWSRPR